MSRVLIVTATLVWLTAVPARGQIFDVTFNELEPGLALTQPVTDPMPLVRPTNVLVDLPQAGDTIEIVTEAGDLTDQPVLFDSVPGGIAWGGFLTPEVHSGGHFSVRWDSLVLGAPSGTDPGPDVGVHMVTRRGDPSVPDQLMVESRWELRYSPAGTFEILDAAGFRSVGTYAVGESDRFELALNLDAGRWDLAVNGDDLLDGYLLTPVEFGGVVLLTSGRGRTIDPPALVMDNLLVREVGDEPRLPGDYSGNGLVEQADLDLVLDNWGVLTADLADSWFKDLSTGVVDQDELDNVLGNWGVMAASAAAPEPSAITLALLLVALAALGARRLTRR